MKRLINILAAIVAMSVIIQISSFGFNLGNAYYAILIGVFILLVFLGKKKSINYFMVWLVFAGFISILLNEIPTFFRPYERLIAFVLVSGLIGPMLRSNVLQAFRQRLFITINAILVVMVILSFLGIAAGLPSMVGRGGFAGLFSHSMILGPMAAIAMLVTINWANQTNSNKKHWMFLTIAAIAFVTCVATGSRAALLAGVAGVLFFYYKINQGRLTRYARVIIVIAVIGIFSFPLWESYTERLISKMAYGEQQGDALFTRAKLWETRLIEFKSSPIIGVGFAAVDTNISIKFDKTKGSVEPGSSWLAVLSMTGLLGFIPFLWLTLRYIGYVFRDKSNRKNSAFLGGILFLLIVHMMAEGYVLSAGSGLFFYFWLAMGITEQTKNTNY